VHISLTSRMRVVESFRSQIVYLDDGGVDDDERSRNSGELEGVF